MKTSFSIIYRIAKKEWTEAYRNGYLRWLPPIFLVLTCISFTLSSIEYQKERNLREATEKEVRGQWLGQGQKNPHAAGHFGTYVFKRQEPLAIVERGVTDYLGRWLHLETHTVNQAEKKPIKDATYLQRFGYFTPGFFLQFLVPAFIILLVYKVFSAEKEQQVFPLLLIQGATPFKLFWGKALAMGVVVAALVFGGFLLSIGFILLQAKFSFQLLLSLGLMFFFLGIYYFTFLWLGMGISAWVDNSHKSLAILCGTWLMVTVFIPRLFTTLAEGIAKAPSSLEVKLAFDEAYRKQWDNPETFQKRFAAMENELMEGYGVSDPDSLPVNPFGLVIEGTEAEASSFFEKKYGEIFKIFNRQDNLHRASAIFSPLAAIRFLSMGLANNSIESYTDFTVQAESYRRDMMYTLNMDIAYNSQNDGYGANKKKGPYLRGQDLWEQIPDFSYRPLPLGKVIGHCQQDMWALCAWHFLSLGFALGCIWKLNRIN